MKRNSTMSLFAAMLLLTGSGCILMTSCQKDYDGQIEILRNQIENGDVNVDNLLEKIELTSNPQLSSSASFLRLNVLSSLN